MNRFSLSAIGRCFALCMPICALLTTVSHAKIKMLSISSASEKLAIKNYRITNIVDERLDQSSIGYLTTGAHNYFLQANFRQPLKDELTQFLQENTAPSSLAEAVELHVYEYLLYEKSSFKGAEIALNTHYAIYSKAGDRLLDYYVTDTRNTGMNMGANAGELMRRNMLNYLSSVDSKIAPLFVQLKKEEPVKVSYMFIKEPQQKNLLCYNPQRPLNVFHFVARPPANASTPTEADCGLKISYEVKEVAGKAEAMIWLLPYFDQARSWMKAGSDNKKILDYQQTYFKISAYVSNELIKELQERSFTFNNLKADMTALREKYNTLLKELQEQYKIETAYGNNAESMEKWRRKVSFYPAYASK